MLTPEQLIPLLDLTRLDEADHVVDIELFCKKAITSYGKVAAVCVYPWFVKDAVQFLKNTSIHVATVANFPDGNQPQDAVKREILQAIANGAHEIDVVLPYTLLLKNEEQNVLAFIKSCRHLCKEGIILKIILETGALNKPEFIEKGALLAIHGGADFIKTSTGKIEQGSTFEAAEIILGVIKRYKHKKIGFKVSGGVRKVTDALHYAKLTQEILGDDWLSPKTFRIGASQLLDHILEGANNF